MSDNNNFRTKRVVGGVKPTETAQTAVAILRHSRFVCAGTVLSDTWVISSKNCFWDRELRHLQVVAGEMDLTEYNHSTTAVIAGIKQLNLYPEKRLG